MRQGYRGGYSAPEGVMKPVVPTIGSGVQSFAVQSTALFDREEIERLTNVLLDAVRWYEDPLNKGLNDPEWIVQAKLALGLR